MATTGDTAYRYRHDRVVGARPGDSDSSVRLEQSRRRSNASYKLAPPQTLDPENQFHYPERDVSLAR